VGRKIEKKAKKRTGEFRGGQKTARGAGFKIHWKGQKAN